MQAFCHISSTCGDHETEPETDPGGIDDTDHNADRSRGGAYRQCVLNAHVKAVE